MATSILVTLIYAIIVVAVLCGLCWALLYVCDRFAVPAPVRWIIGVFLIIVILLVTLSYLPAGGHPLFLH